MQMLEFCCCCLLVSRLCFVFPGMYKVITGYDSSTCTEILIAAIAAWTLQPFVVLVDLGWSTRNYVLVVSSDRKIVGAQRMNVIHKLRLLCN